jgi:hypothetical protein
MKDLFEQILKYLPHYLTEYGAAFSGPKSFIATKVRADADDAFGEALLFLGISLTLVLLMYMPLLPAGKDFWSFAVRYYVSYIIEIPLHAYERPRILRCGRSIWMRNHGFGRPPSIPALRR